MANPNPNEVPQTPTAVSAAVLHPHPITLGQICLLEEIHSPFIYREGKKEPSGVDYARSIFLLSFPSQEGCKHLENLTAEAMAYIDTIPLEDFRRKIREGYAAVNAFYDVLPRATEGENSGKKDSPATGSC